MKTDLGKILLEHGLRTTAPRVAIFETLQRTNKPLSQVELAEMNPHIDRVSVYRTIDVFMKLGIVMSVPHGWKQRFELAEPHRPHHHHLLCTECGRVESLQSAETEQKIHDIAASHDFLVTGHTFEITGLCPDCRRSHT